MEFFVEKYQSYRLILNEKKEKLKVFLCVCIIDS